MSIRKSRCVFTVAAVEVALFIILITAGLFAQENDAVSLESILQVHDYHYDRFRQGRAVVETHQVINGRIFPHKKQFGGTTTVIDYQFPKVLFDEKRLFWSQIETRKVGQQTATVLGEKGPIQHLYDGEKTLQYFPDKNLAEIERDAWPKHHDDMQIHWNPRWWGVSVDGVPLREWVDGWESVTVKQLPEGRVVLICERMKKLPSDKKNLVRTEIVCAPDKEFFIEKLSTFMLLDATWRKLFESTIKAQKIGDQWVPAQVERTVWQAKEEPDGSIGEMIEAVKWVTSVKEIELGAQIPESEWQINIPQGTLFRDHRVGLSYRIGGPITSAEEKALLEGLEGLAVVKEPKPATEETKTPEEPSSEQTVPATPTAPAVATSPAPIIWPYTALGIAIVLVIAGLIVLLLKRRRAAGQ